jgi:malate dehydrogenase (oxaloacetate-decarboxylating)
VIGVTDLMGSELPAPDADASTVTRDEIFAGHERVANCP